MRGNALKRLDYMLRNLNGDANHGAIFLKPCFKSFKNDALALLWSARAGRNRANELALKVNRKAGQSGRAPSIPTQVR